MMGDLHSVNIKFKEYIYKNKINSITKIFITYLNNVGLQYDNKLFQLEILNYFNHYHISNYDKFIILNELEIIVFKTYSSNKLKESIKHVILNIKYKILYE